MRKSKRLKYKSPRVLTKAVFTETTQTLLPLDLCCPECGAAVVLSGLLRHGV